MRALAMSGSAPRPDEEKARCPNAVELAVVRQGNLGSIAAGAPL
jgi:hypothetical protein